jgi:hypothetical protein
VCSPIETLHQMEEPDDIEPSRCNTLLRYTWKLCTCLFSHVTLVSLVVSYCIMGAFTFQNLEGHHELKVSLRNLLVALRYCTQSVHKEGTNSDTVTMLKECSKVVQDNSWCKMMSVRKSVAITGRTHGRNIVAASSS